MKYSLSAMLHKLFFLVVVLFGLNLTTTTATFKNPFLHNVLKLSKSSSDNSLINNACKAAGPQHEPECISTLESAPAHQKANATELAFYTLRFVENHAENVTTDIKNVQQLPEVTPMLQSALTDCSKQYISVDDLIEDAINALLANALDDTKQFIDAASDSIAACEEQLKNSNSEEKAEKKVQGKDYQLAKALQEFNDFLKCLLATAMNIVKTN